MFEFLKFSILIAIALFRNFFFIHLYMDISTIPIPWIC